MEKSGKIVVYKSQRILVVFQNNLPVKTYPIDLGRAPIGHKQFEGDNKTPEGNYCIVDKNENSTYFLNLGIDYPNARDMAFANAEGKSAGGNIKIHGQPNNPALLPHYPCPDWTAGCIALSNDDMKELFTRVQIGTPIEILS